MEEIIRTIKVNSEEETKEFGHKLAEELNPGDILGLIGDLGTGKTALTRYIAEGLGITDRISSPTFTIVKEYLDNDTPLYHFDVYRVSDYDELFNIGFEEYLYGEGGHKKGISMVEWADLVKDDMPPETKYIFIEYGQNEGEREYKCTF